VISSKRLVDFGALHPHATVSLKIWRRCIEANAFEHFADLRRVFGSVDRVGAFCMFDIGGNKYRLVAAIHFNHQVLYVRHVFTHAEYDRWSPP
jgi:mRNA interferase HigB